MIHFMLVGGIMALIAQPPEVAAPTVPKAGPAPVNIPAPPIGVSATNAIDAALLARLTEIDSRIGAISSLRADFEQRKHTALLKEPLVSSGTLMVKGERVRWDTKAPHPSVLAIAAGEIRIYYPEAAIVEIHAIQGDLREVSGSPLPRLETLRKRYSIKPLELATMGVPASDTGHIAIELIPTAPDLKKHVAKIRVLLDSRIPCVKKLEVTDIDDERTEIEFRNVRISAEVADAELDLKVPAGTRESRPVSLSAPPATTKPPETPAKPPAPGAAPR